MNKGIRGFVNGIFYYPITNHQSPIANRPITQSSHQSSLALVTFEDIMTQEMVYFDRAHEAACAAFCREREIAFMPAADDDYGVYALSPNGKFVKQDILDPARRKDLVQEVVYRFNGEVIRRLRTLTGDLLNMDTYPYVSDAALEAGSQLKAAVFEKLKAAHTVGAQWVNELAGWYMKHLAWDMLHKLRENLPQAVSDDDWNATGKAFLHQLDSDVVRAIAPNLVYRMRREWYDPMKIVHPKESIFKEDVYEKIRRGSLLIVWDRGERVGLVHFSDYNRLPVFTYTFKRLHRLERALVQALTQRHLTLKDVEDVHNRYPIAEGELNNLRARKNHDRAALLKYHDLERLYLKTLLSLFNHRREGENTVFTPIRNVNIINLLRNRIAHSNDLVELADTTRNNLIYDFKSFAAFFRQQRALEVALRQVESHNFYATL